jgi:hypothetical protein
MPILLPLLGSFTPSPKSLLEDERPKAEDEEDELD